MCRENGLVKLGHVALDGTKVKANASKHKAMSYGRMRTEEERLAREIDEMVREAAKIDETDLANTAPGTLTDSDPGRQPYGCRRSALPVPPGLRPPSGMGARACPAPAGQPLLYLSYR